MRFGGNLAVATGSPQKAASPNLLHQILNVGYLLQLAQHERSQVTFWIVLNTPACAFKVETFPEDGADSS